MHVNFANKTKLVVVAFTLAVLIIIVGAILPTASNIYGINRATLDLRTYLEQKYKNAVDLRQATSKITNAKEQTANFSSALYHAGDELKLITFLENTASKNNLTQKIQTANLDKPQNQNIKISINLSGQYRDALEFLTDLETAPYFLNFLRLQISTTNSATGKNNATGASENFVNMDIDLQIYVAT